MPLQRRAESWGHMELLCVHWWYSADDSQLGCSPKSLLDLVALWSYFTPCCGWKRVCKHLINHVGIAFFLTRYKELHKNRVMIELSLVFLCILKLNISLPSSMLWSQKSEKNIGSHGNKWWENFVQIQKEQLLHFYFIRQFHQIIFLLTSRWLDLD